MLVPPQYPILPAMSTVPAHRVLDLNEPTDGATIIAIVSADNTKNYAGKGHNPEITIKGIVHGMQVGDSVYRSGDCLYLVHGDEWHTCNGGHANDLIASTNDFFDLMKLEGHQYLITYYDNPKISGCLAQSKYVVEIQQVSEGEYRTYKAKVRF